MTICRENVGNRKSIEHRGTELGINLVCLRGRNEKEVRLFLSNSNIRVTSYYSRSI